MGSVSGERRSVLRQGQLQQALLRQNGKASEIMCSSYIKIQKVGRSKDFREKTSSLITIFNTLSFMVQQYLMEPQLVLIVC